MPFQGKRRTNVGTLQFRAPLLVAMIAFLQLSITLSGCSKRRTKKARCISGRSVECYCSSGVTGVQKCRNDGIFSPCVCEAPKTPARKAPAKKTQTRKAPAKKAVILKEEKKSEVDKEEATLDWERRMLFPRAMLEEAQRQVTKAWQRCTSPSEESFHFEDLNGDGRRDIVVKQRCQVETDCVSCPNVSETYALIVSDGKDFLVFSNNRVAYMVATSAYRCDSEVGKAGCFVTYVEDWHEDDPNCCPTMCVEHRFQWDGRKKTWVENRKFRYRIEIEKQELCDASSAYKARMKRTGKAKPVVPAPTHAYTVTTKPSNFSTSSRRQKQKPKRKMDMVDRIIETGIDHVTPSSKGATRDLQREAVRYIITPGADFKRLEDAVKRAAGGK